MAIQPKLLAKARAAGARMADAERRFQQARSEYHSIVRRLHLAGGSLRELAQALELSHQRVQQIVDGAGGSWWRRAWRSRRLKGNLSCTVCGRSQSEVAKLIAGPKVFICDICVELAEKTMSCKSAPTARGLLTLAGDNAGARCSFCRKRRAAGRPMVTGPAANICGECLSACRQILTDTEVGVVESEIGPTNS